jgi:hypothetical protein
LDGAQERSALPFLETDDHIHKLIGFLKTQDHITESNGIETFEPTDILEAPYKITSPKLLTFLKSLHSLAQYPITDVFIAEKLKPSDRVVLRFGLPNHRSLLLGWLSTSEPRERRISLQGESFFSCRSASKDANH